jgi:cell wall-associated NlpC family hydrolase/phage-related minor tail protein
MARTLALVLLGVDKLSKTLKSAEGGLEKLQSKMQRFDAAANVVGVAAGAAFAGGFVKALDVSAGQAKMSAQLGLTARESKRVGGVAGKVFAGAFGDSMETVNTAVVSVIQNIDGMRTASSSALQATTERALTLADVMGEDVTKVTAAVSTLMKNNLAPNGKAAFDVITRATQLGANKQQDLLDTLIEYPTLFRNMGLSAQQATGLMVQGLQAGARDSDKVADAIKEFSIRAVDGSKLTGEGFKMIGLNADSMAQKIGKGGKTAAGALQLTLEKLRGIKDPVAQSRAAVALFGTTAEDLGQALFALNLDTAGKEMSGFAGSTDRASKVMGESAASRIESFKRTLVSTFVDVIGNQVIPKVIAFIDWMKKIGVTPSGLLMLGGVFVGLAVAVKLVSGVLMVYRGIVLAVSSISKIAAVGTRIWAAAVWVLNAAMRANPIGIIITIIMALVGALVVAYNKSKSFREIVDAAWTGIKNAVSVAWNTVIKPAFEAIKNWIVTELAPRFIWFHNNIVAPAWKAISFIIGVAWGIIKIIFAAIKFYVEKIIAPVIMWLWKNIITPAWKAISSVISVAWGIIKIIFAALKFYVEKVLAPVFTWIWKNIITPVFNGIKAVISTVWNNGVKPIFENMKRGVELVGKAFESGKNFIGRVWDKVRDLAMRPVRFIVDTVYTKGIKGVWDKVAKFVNADPLPAAPKFATGGPIRQGTGPKADDVLIRASRNEYVINAASVANNLPLIDFINRRGKNKSVMKSLGLAGDPGGVLPGFAEGGIIGWVKSFAAKAKDGFLDGVISAANGVFNPIRGLIDSTLGGTGIGRTIGGVPKKYMNDFLGWLASHKSKIEGSGNTGAVKAARSQLGVPYSWGGGGPGGPSYGFAQGANIRGFDCSSLMQYSWYKATGKVMPRTTYSQWPWLNKVATPQPGDLGFPHMGHVFMKSGPNSIIEAPFTGARVREVSQRPAKWGRPPASFMRADDGMARLSPGMNAVYNGTGGMETLSNNPPIIIERLDLHFSDDRNMREKGAEFAEGLRYYANQGGRLPAKLIGN